MDKRRYRVDESHWIATFAFGHSGKAKMLRYDLTKLLQFGGVLTMRMSGTVFTMDRSLVRNTGAMLLVLFLVCAMTVIYAGGKAEGMQKVESESLVELADHINAFVPFALGLYISLTLTRLGSG